jgi:hypothetical protein
MECKASKERKTNRAGLSLEPVQSMGAGHSMFPNIGYTDDWHSYNVRNYREINYEITVENTGESVLNGIRIEYCIYHQATIRERIAKGRHDAYNKDSSGVVSGGWVSTDGSESLPTRKALDAITGEILFKELQSNDEITEQTVSLKQAEDRKESYEVRLNARLRERHERTIDGELLGIRCRVYVPTPSGSYTMFQFADPESLLTEMRWVTPEQSKKSREEALSRFEKTTTNRTPLLTYPKGKMPGSKK